MSNSTNGPDRTRPSDATRAAEKAEAQQAHVPDRAPTAEESQDAEQAPRDPEAAGHFEEMAKRGANQQGEGRVP